MIVCGATGLNVNDSVISNDLCGLCLSGAPGAVVRGDTISGSRLNGLIAYDSNIDVRNNRWGAASVPNGGVGEVVNACTGATADGSGDRIAVEPMFTGVGERQP